MKTFGLVVPKGQGSAFDRNVCVLLDDADKAVATIVLPLLDVWRTVRKRAAALDRHPIRAARQLIITRGAR